MSWAAPLEITQMTLRGNPLLLSRDWSASLRVCAVVFVYVGWGHVSRSDGAVSKVQGEPFLLGHLFFLPDWLQRFSCIFTVGCCGMWRRALALKHVCVFACVWTRACTCSMKKWDRGGSRVGAFSSSASAFFLLFAALWMSALDAVLEPSRR